jgi:hypothetical protein
MVVRWWVRLEGYRGGDIEVSLERRGGLKPGKPPYQILILQVADDNKANEALL